MNVRRIVSGDRMLRRTTPVAGEMCACCDGTPGGSAGLLKSWRNSPPPILVYFILGSILCISFESSAPHDFKSRYRSFASKYFWSLPGVLSMNASWVAFSVASSSFFVMV